MRVHHQQQQAATTTAHSASISSNYSATSSLPAALKRALVSMGRSLTGQAGAATANPSATFSATPANATNGPDQTTGEAGPLTG